MLTGIVDDANGINHRRQGSAIFLILLAALKILGWALFPATWSVVTVAAWTSWVAFWLYRTSWTDPTATSDLLILLFVEVWEFPWRCLSVKPLCSAMWCSDPITWQVLALLGVCAVLAGIGVRREQNHQEHHLEPIPEIEPFDNDFLVPMLLPSRTTHTRIFPKRHSFSYSYLLVGIPVGWRGSIGSVLSVDTQVLPLEERQRGWFHISGADYLDRDDSRLDLKAKLASYLQSQGENPGDFPHVYLVTAPKFLGYSFNPVSFWYLYSELRQLKAMILEVNNTFGERRIYFLNPPATRHDATKPVPDVAAELLTAVKDFLLEGGRLNVQPYVFSDAWSKDFHVSPFNDRRGSYSLAAHDPLTNNERSKWLLDNTIVLRSAESRPKLIARIFADGDPLDPRAMGQLNFWRFVIAWWWVGFLTFPRIIKEAYLLYFNRGLPVWFRPEVDKRSLGRRPTSSESILERYFQRYLEYLVKHASHPLSIAYKPPSGMGIKRAFKTIERYTDEQITDVQLNVLTPAFYSRFVHYAHTSEAFDRECLCSDDLNRTLWISNPAVLPNLLDEGKSNIYERPEDRQIEGEHFLESLRWAMLRKLRCSPPVASYPANQPQNPSISKQDIRSIPYSRFDTYVRRNFNDSWIYRRTATRLFLAQRFAYGFESPLSMVDLLLRCALLLFSWHDSNKKYITGNSAFRTWSLKHMACESLELLVMNLVHIWALLK